jgi:hypothetical protein
MKRYDESYMYGLIFRGSSSHYVTQVQQRGHAAADRTRLLAAAIAKGLLQQHIAFTRLLM